MINGALPKCLFPVANCALFVQKEIGFSVSASFRSGVSDACAELSMGWVDPWVGLGWVGLGWVGSTTAKVLKFERISLLHLKHG